VYALNIMNDKANYILSKSDIRAKIEKLPKNEPASGEFSSILGGIAALERMPNYVREEIHSDPNMSLITLEMPYRISLKDIEKAYNTSGLKEKDFEDLITENNRMIEEALDDARYDKDWGIVEPPLGRLLSKPAVEYQRAMLNNHPDLINKIREIKSRM